MTWGSSMVKLGWWWVYHKEKIGVFEEILSLDIQDEKMKKRPAVQKSERIGNLRADGSFQLK